MKGNDKYLCLCFRINIGTTVPTLKEFSAFCNNACARNSLTALDIESILMEIRGKGARQRSTIRSNLHALTPQARLIDNPCVIVTSVKSLEHPRPIAIN